MSARAPLVEDLAALLEQTYDIEPGLRPIGRFIVGDDGHARLLARSAVREVVDHDGSGARLLLRRVDGQDGWAAALYLPDAMIASLERDDPRRTLHDGNAGAFVTLVEEIDHLVTFADRVCRQGGEVSLLELEWHAGISKYLVATHFVGRLSGRRTLSAGARAFVERHVFHDVSYDGLPAALRERYERADQLAIRFVRDLQRARPAERLARLRRFHRASHHEKLRRFAG
ncbi:MAG: hypothetical protein HC882_05955 [Acidobacteria bacterium]|nr:hypothetical protein [Acidobacteriota bacterium]